MNRTVVNGVELAYEDEGRSEHAIVLVHGHPFNRSMWRPQIEAVGRAGWRAIAPDLRGYGASAVVPGITPLDLFAADIFGLLDHLEIASAVFVGLSMGGQIVMECARSAQARVRGLVLTATFPQAEAEEGKVARRAMAERLLREGMGPYSDDVLPKMIAPHNIAAFPDVAADVLAMMKASPPEGAAAALRGRAERPPYEPTLAQFERPALVIVGDHDAFTTRADADNMLRLLKQSRLCWMEGAGHMPNLERPTEFNAALLEFLSTLV